MEKRRQFLKLIFGLFIGASLLFRFIFQAADKVYAKAKKIILPKNTDRETLRNKDPSLLNTRNLEPTPMKDFETMGDSDYRFDIGDWRLEVTGRVKRPLRLSYSQILALPSIERDVLLICPGFFANHGRWKGFSMEKLLGQAQMDPAVTHVTFSAPDDAGGNEEKFPLSDILSNRVFLAYGVNKETLPIEHGFPLRVVAEGHYGSAWIKYVNRVTLDKA